MRTKQSQSILREETFEINEPEVSIKTVAGQIQVLESSDEKSHIRILGNSSRAKELAAMAEITQLGRNLKVEIDQKNQKFGFGSFISKGNSDFLLEVSIPKSSSLQVKTVVSETQVDASLRELEISSVSGNVTVLQNPSGSCILKTVAADITAHTFSACQYNLKSVSGDINVYIAPGLEVDVDGKSLNGKLASEISLDDSTDASQDSAELVTIRTSTVNGDITISREV